MSLCLKQYNVTSFESIEAQVPTMVCEALFDLLTTTSPYFLPNSCISHSASHKLYWFEQAWDTSLSGLYTLYTLSLECFSPVLSEFLLHFFKHWLNCQLLSEACVLDHPLCSHCTHLPLSCSFFPTARIMIYYTTILLIEDVYCLSSHYNKAPWD